MKRRFPIALALLCLMALLLPAAAQAIASSSTDVQDFYHYSVNYPGSKLTPGEISLSDGRQVRSLYSDTIDDGAIVKQFVKDLTNGSWNFKLVHEWKPDYMVGYAAVLAYTGSARITDSIECFGDNDYKGQLMVYYIKDYSHLRGQLWIAKGLSFSDLGLRKGGQVVSLAMPGKSAKASLKVNGDTYSTSDGRLSVGRDQAVVFRDGKKYSTSAKLVRDTEADVEKLTIPTFYRNEGVAMTFPLNSLMTGDSMNERTMGIGSLMLEDWVGSLNEFFDWVPKYKLGVCHNGSYLFCHQDHVNDFSRALVRVMLWETGKNIGVFYFDLVFDTAPYELEGLAAVSLSNTHTADDDLEKHTITVGATQQLTFNDRVYSPAYEVYTWQIISGGNRVSLANEKFQTCTVTGLSEGEARVRVTYEYGVDEPDVLTGIPRNVNKIKQQEFIITVSGGAPAQTKPDGLAFEDGVFRYYEGGRFNDAKNGFVGYDGQSFLVIGGVVASSINGLVQDPERQQDWYYCAAGQVARVTQLVQYDNHWFYVTDGKLNTTLGGFVDYDGSKFFVSSGQIRTDISGLVQDPNVPSNWYYVSDGQVQTGYTGLAQYDGAWFYVVNGKLATDFTGDVPYDGAWFRVVNGMVAG